MQKENCLFIGKESRHYVLLVEFPMMMRARGLFIINHSTLTPGYLARQSTHVVGPHLLA